MLLICVCTLFLNVLISVAAAGIGLDYVTNDDSMKRPFDTPPVIVNYFYHEQIKKSARKGGDSHAGITGSRSD